jgi:hypothetical protein
VNALALRSTISEDTEVAAASRSRLLSLPMRSIFPNHLRNRRFSRLRRETALRGRRLTKGEENERIIINRSGRPTYPEQKSVLTSGATPNFCRRYETTLSS